MDTRKDLNLADDDTDQEDEGTLSNAKHKDVSYEYIMGKG
jgi:hypothetical protein